MCNRLNNFYKTKAAKICLSFFLSLLSLSLHAATLSGVVRDHTGNPIPGAHVRLLEVVEAGSYIPIGDSFQVGSDGAYEWTVEPGSYAIRSHFNANEVSLLGAPTLTSYSSEDFDVYDQTTRDTIFNFVMVSGKVVDRNNAPIPNVAIETGILWHGPERGSLDEPSQQSLSHEQNNIMTDEDGNYAMLMFATDNCLVSGFYDDSNDCLYDITYTPPETSGFGTATRSDFALSHALNLDQVLILVDQQDPEIVAGPFIKNVTDRSAIIEWQTDEPVTSAVSVVNGDIFRDNTLRTRHSTVLTGFAPFTTYNLAVNVTDQNNNSTSSQTLSLTTEQSNADNLAPRFENAPRATAIFETELTLEFCANEPVSGHFTVNNVSYNLDGFAICHSLTLENLEPNASYQVSAAITDIVGNGPTTSPAINVKTLSAADLTPPLILSGPTITDISDTTAVVKWLTNEPSSSGVSFNDGTNYRVQIDPTLVTEHSALVTGLSPGTAYSLTIESKDAAGNNSARVEEVDFVTHTEPDQTAPLIIGRPLVEDIGDKNALISWQTDESSSTVIHLGASADVLNQVHTAAEFTSAHRLILSDLLPETTYYFSAQSSDLAGNTSEGLVISFTTREQGFGEPLEIISQPVIERLSGNSITLSWKTNLYANSRLVCESTSGTSEVNKTELSKDHVLTLIGLDFETTYRCAVYSSDPTGYIANAVIGALTTDDVDSTPPECATTPSAVGYVSSAEISWESTELSSATLSYREKGANVWLQKSYPSLGTNGFGLLTGLNSDTDYEFQIVLTDAVGNKGTCALGEFNSGSASPEVPAPAFSTDPTVSNVEIYSAVVNWSTERPATGQIRFGTTDGTFDQVLAVPNFKHSHSALMTNLEPATRYFFQVDIFNSEGDVATSNTIDFTTNSLPQIEITPPNIISGPIVRNISDSAAVIEWQTDKASSSQVSLSNGSSLSNDSLTTSHSMLLTGLTPATDYSAEVSSTGENGLNSATSSATFRTLPTPDTKLPQFVIGPFFSAIDYDKFTVSFCADEPVTHTVNVVLAGSEESQDYTSSEAAICHSYLVDGLTQLTQYVVTVAITDIAENGPVQSSPLSVTTLIDLDIEAPSINGPIITDITETSAIVQWSTNEAANSFVLYSDGSGNNVLEDNALVTNHVVHLSGLSPATAYSLIVASTDAAGNGPSVSPQVNFNTLSEPDTSAPLILSGPTVENISIDSANILWTTSESASHQVFLGLSDDALDQSFALTGFSTAHNIPIQNLSADTTYFYRVESADISGNSVSSDVLSFKTQTPGELPEVLEIIAGPVLENVTTDSLTVSWDTNLDSDSRLVCEAESSQSQSADSSSFSGASTSAPVYKASPTQAIDGQYIVILKDPDESSTSGEFYGLSRKQSSIQRKLAVKALATDISNKIRAKVLRRYSNRVAGFVLKMESSELDTLRKDPRVLLIEQDQVMRVSETQRNATWGLDRIDQANLPLDNSFTYELDGTGVNAYIIDTGIMTSHSDFGGRAVSGWDFIDNDPDASDCNGHGTHVAGTVGGTTWGVAKNVSLTAIKVLDCDGSGTSSSVIGGIDWVTANAQFPAVINMSLGGGNSAALDAAVNRAIDAGITVAVAAGNSNINACSGSPNKVPAAITVAASTSSDSRSSFSNWGSCVDLFAPGSSITSAWHNGGTNTINGTSMATPHVAGAVALYLQAHPNASPAEVSSAIKGFATQGKISRLNGSPNLVLNVEFGEETELPAPPPPPPAEVVSYEVSDPQKVKHHLLTLSGLDASTQYSCTIYSSGVNNESVNAPIAGTTADIPDTVDPECTADPAVEAFVDTARISWSASELSTALVNYRQIGDDEWLQLGTLEFATESSLLITGLLPETDYEQQITLNDVAGNSNTCNSGIFSTSAPEATPDAVFDMQPVVTNIGEHSATVSWSTLEASTGNIRYGTVSTNLVEQQADNQNISHHSVELLNLSANTVYYLQVDAFNSLGEKTTSEVVSFTTLHFDYDFDNDGIINEIDNCPLTPNPDQVDSDNDGAGDACDPPLIVDNDFDNDGVLNDVDNCPVTANPDQADTDNDGIGDACDTPLAPDFDQDGISDDLDNCPLVPNADQLDTDSDGIGDACDTPLIPDYDNDGILDDVDNCPLIPNADQLDTDGDGIGDACDTPEVIDNDYDNDGIQNDVDNCPLTPNADQEDTDNDGLGDACDRPEVVDYDFDKDGVLNDADNCPINANPDQLDSDGDGIGDACDTPEVIDDDYDNDGVLNDNDNCPLTANPDQADTDNDGIGDACDTPAIPDFDNDGIPDDQDNCPTTPNADQSDEDNNGIGDACDAPASGGNDQDEDGVLDDADNCPTVANPNQSDQDNNGIGDACDVPAIPDHDEDGVADDADSCPLSPNADQADADNDGIGDACDTPEPVENDFDNDGVLDEADNCPVNANPDQTDSDNDGIGDACDMPVVADNDQDDDGILDDVDNCPLIPNADQSDSDNDGLGDACDAPTEIEQDTDNDGIVDDVDNCPLTANPDQADSDNNGIGDACDAPPVSDNDYDDDGIQDEEDNCPRVPNSDQSDSDNDGLGDACDAPEVIENDFDQDGVLDGVDNCPTTPNADQADRDDNGIGDACDVPEVITPPPVEPVGITLRGLVNSEGAPVQGAEVAIYNAQRQFIKSSSTPEDGSYSFEYMEAGDYFIGVTPPNDSGLSSPTLQPITIADRDLVHLITMIGDALSLSGYLRDSQGRAIDQVLVSLHNQTTGNQVGNRIQTDELGYFEFSVAPGTYKLRPLIDLFGAQSSDKPSYPVPDFAAVFHAIENIQVTQDTLVEALMPFAILSGQTLDQQGNPIPGVGLRIRHQFSTSERQFYLENYASDSQSNAISDDSGNFQFALFTQQEVDILLSPPANRPDLAVTTVENYYLDGDSSESFTLVAGESLSGILKDTQGRPIDHTKVSLHLQQSGEQIGHPVFTDETGRYQFQVENGSYKIKPHLNPFGENEANRPNYPLPDFATVLYAEENVDVSGATVRDITLPMAILTASVTDANGASVPNTKISISHIAQDTSEGRERGFYLESQGSSLVTNAITNASGEFSLALFTEQAMNINLIPPIGNNLVAATLINDYQLASDTSDTFMLGQPYTLSGYMRDEQGNAIDHSMITVHNQSTRQLADSPVLTNAEGYFEFKVSAGNYQLRPYLQTINQVDGAEVSTTYPVPDFAAIYYAPKNISVLADTSIDVVLPMSVLSGQALDANGVAVPGVKLRIDHAHSENSTSYYLENTGDDSNSNAISNAEGEFAFGLFTNQSTDVSVNPPEGSGFAITNVSHNISQETSENIWLIHSNFAAPEIIAGPFVKHITDTNAVVEWLTDKPGTSVVDLSNGQRYQNPEFNTDHSVILTNLDPETLYRADVHSIDKDNHPTETASASFTTLATPDYRAPLILEGPFASNITHEQFTLSLCADEPVIGSVTVSGVSYALSSLAVCHDLVVNSLSPDTAYTVVAAVTDEQGNGPTVSQPMIVTTLAQPDETPPEIQLIPMVIDISDTSATVIWTTDEQATSGVSYNDGTQYHVVSNDQLVKQHSMPLIDLSPETTYMLTVSSSDAHGNGPSTSEAISFTTLAAPDETAPIIIGSPLIQNITHQSVVVRWDTSEPATTHLVIGTSDNDLSSAETKSGLRTKHNLPVTGLTPDTIYYFQVQTSDAQGNMAMSELMSFRTKVRGHQGDPHFMSDIQIKKLTDTKLTVYWETDVNADARLVCASDNSGTKEVNSSKRTKKHTLTLTGLDPDTAYSCTAYSTDHHGYTASQALSEVIVTSTTSANFSSANFVGVLASDTVPPLQSSEPVIKGYGELASIEISTNELSVVFVEYRLAGTTSWQSAGSLEESQLHTLLIEGLEANSEYQLRVTLADIDGNTSESELISFNSGTLTDIAQPIIAQEATVSFVSQSSAIIAWQSAEGSIGQVSYGKRIEELLDKEANIGLAQQHQLNLVRLDPATVYYAQARTYNLLGEFVDTEVVRFITSAVNDEVDSDSDGIPDALEIESGLDPQDPLDAARDSDNDGLSNLEEFVAQTNINASDTDNDGIPDGWEVDHDLNPNDPSDGPANLAEYQNANDTIPPVISLDSEISIASTGPLTAIPTTNIVVSDNLDGNLSAENVGATHLPPGRHVVNWQAEDSAGNRTVAAQTVNIKPQVSFVKSQVTSENNLVTLRLSLNGDAPTYPVLIPYSISGSASSLDYDLARDSDVLEGSTGLHGTVTIHEGLHGEIKLQILGDQVTEGDEELIVSFDTPDNAVLNADTDHLVTITEGNIPPHVSLVSLQDNLQVSTFSKSGGPAIIHLVVTDLNAEDAHGFDWSETDNSLVDTDSNPITFTFDPGLVDAGVYTVNVTVEDDGSPKAYVSKSLNIRIVDSYPILTANADTDGDGISDLEEGLLDSDSDGIADYLDKFEGSTWLQQQVANNPEDSYLMQTETGLSLALGALAMNDANGGSLVSDANFSNSDLFSQFGLEDDYTLVGGLFDFEVHEVAPQGRSVKVVIPLLEAIPANADYRKLDKQNGWSAFEIDENNKLYTSTGSAGVCPSPHDSSYQEGLNEGHYCLMLLIQDGGPNDADGEVNGTIVDPGGVASQKEEVEPPVIVTPAPAPSSGGGGGSTDPILLLLCLSLLLTIRRMTKQS